MYAIIYFHLFSRCIWEPTLSFDVTWEQRFSGTKPDVYHMQKQPVQI